MDTGAPLVALAAVTRLPPAPRPALLHPGIPQSVLIEAEHAPEHGALPGRCEPPARVLGQQLEQLLQRGPTAVQLPVQLAGLSAVLASPGLQYGVQRSDSTAQPLRVPAWSIVKSSHVSCKQFWSCSWTSMYFLPSLAVRVL